MIKRVLTRILKVYKHFVKKVYGEFEERDIDLEIAMIKQSYYYRITLKKVKPVIIFKLDSRYDTNGFADRLRGMISTYAYAKAIGHDFRIDHVDPFDLAIFYSPNEVDWILKDGEETLNSFQALPIMVINFSAGKRIPWLPRCMQYHFYTNVDFIQVINDHYGTNYKYHELFQELFRPSPYLYKNILPYKTFIDEGYISISFRFMQLMGDLKDVRGNILNDHQKKTYISKCIKFIESIHNNNPQYRHILVTSDSKTFMSRIESIPYIFIIPGEIGHIGHMKSEAIYLKTLVDFHMISLAKEAYMGYTGEMYRSQFAKSAALTTGIPYEEIQF